MSFSVIIIGGGASGLAAAIFAAGRGASVTVLEKSEKPLKKLLVTGNGHCNLTNLRIREDSWRGAEPELIRRVIDRYGVHETLAFFESIGVFTREKDGWVYPVNGQASSVASHLLKEAEALKVKIKTREEVTGIEKSEGGFLCRTSSYEYGADAVIVASGTCAYYGDGYTSIAEETAARFSVPFRAYEPALVPLVLEGAIVGKWGVDRLPGVIRLYENGKMTAERSGELQLAAYGVSGIPVLQISSLIRKEASSAYEAALDLLPQFKKEELAGRVAAAMEGRPERDVSVLLSGLLPEKLFRAVYTPGEAPEEFIGKIKDLRFKVRKKKGMENARTASGGVLLSALSGNLEAKNTKGLYFIGEAADADGDCGGYSLQWAWSSAHAAAYGLEL